MLLYSKKNQILCTSNIGGCVAVITWNSKTREASIAHLMIKLTDVLDYQTWFNGLNLEKEDLCIALVGGSNTILNPQDPIQSSRELVAALKQFFDEKNLSVQYEDLYAENEQMNTRHIDLINGNLKIETEIHSAITYENLDENIKEIDLNDLIQPSSQLSGRFTP